MSVKGETARVLRPAAHFSGAAEIVTRAGEAGFVTILTHEHSYRSASGEQVRGSVTCVALEPADAVEVARGLLAAAAASGHDVGFDIW